MRSEILSFLESARKAVKEVMPVVSQAAGRMGDTATKKRDGSIVTSIDQQVEAQLVTALSRALPNASVLGEEGGIDSSGEHTRSAEELYGSFMSTRFQLIVDPIDGTRNFVDGHGQYCVAAALSERVDGGIWPISAVIGIPAEQAVYWCDEKGVYREDETSGRTDPVTPLLDADAPTSVNSRDRTWLSQEGFTLIKPWMSSGSSICDLLGTALGRLSGSIVGSQRLWDLMPPLAVAVRLGLVLRDLSTGDRMHAIGVRDLGVDLVARPWSLSRRMILLRPDVEISSIVRPPG